jgi:hypothetical protein
MELLRYVVYLFLTYLISTYLYNLLRHYFTALKSGLPVIVQPYQRLHPLAMLTCGINKPIITRLPFGLSRWKFLHFLYRDWEFQTGFQQFAEYGDVFIEVRSIGRLLYVANAEAANQIFMRRNDFPKDLGFYSTSPPLHTRVMF